jgi:hypothetical protein
MPTLYLLNQNPHSSFDNNFLSLNSIFYCLIRSLVYFTKPTGQSYEQAVSIRTETSRVPICLTKDLNTKYSFIRTFEDFTSVERSSFLFRLINNFLL